jgi:DMSO/TMAO reductase YedYZ molybdopterin-dependent catalytic subunit
MAGTWLDVCVADEAAGSGLARATLRDGAARARSLLSPWGPPLDAGSWTRKQRRVPFIAGTLAAGAALNVSIVMRLFGAGVFVPEAAVEWVVDGIPGALEAGAVGLMGGYAKVLGVTVAIVGFVLVFGAAALYYPRFDALLKSRYRVVATFFAGPSAGTLLLALPLFGDGFLGSRAPGGMAAAVGGTLAMSAVYAGVLEAAYREFHRSHPDGFDVTRRTLLQAAAVALLLGALGLAAVGTTIVNTGRLAFASVLDLFDHEVTPTSSFYVVQKNLTSPTVDPSSWSLTVDGLVSTPLTLSSNELLARRQSEQVVTLECVSNQVGGALISNGRWSGVPLAALFAEAGIQPSATWVLFTCADDYTVAVPLLRTSSPGALVALQLNGERLPRDHGFPARVLVPGVYGMMNAKWVVRITLTDHEVLGFWQKKGWSNEASIRTAAYLAVAPRSASVGVPAALGGVAFAGDRPITRVEVSDDGGASWANATLKPPLSAYAWTLWTYDWTPRNAGRARIQVRAWERRQGVEVVQEGGRQDPFPRGASGYDAVEVSVA